MKMIVSSPVVGVVSCESVSRESFSAILNFIGTCFYLFATGIVKNNIKKKSKDELQ